MRGPVWVKDAGAPEAAGFMRVQVPGGATEVKGAVQDGFQDSVYLLSFAAPTVDAETFTADLRPEGGLRAITPVSSADSVNAELWAHVGLPDPATQERVREGSVCPPCIGDGRRSKVQGIDIDVQDLGGGRSRVYLRATS
ncbi:hypothetical protein GPJ59_29020 [Streptomyces bambusae]|uniref:Uncharacterized protein n=1 Tax=Streptomyces bambusae TaxID=1550616 RepID=A0ABS6ZDG7_9ACTN|nr:hypothetical protein [Streptomyces bambusae]